MLFITAEERRSRYIPHKSIYELERAHDLYIPQISPLIQIDGQTLLTRDNIMVIGGRAKSGKTFLISALIADSIFELEIEYRLGFSVSKIWQYDNVNTHKHILHFDTEQQEPEYKRMLNDICRIRGGSMSIPDYLCSFSLADKTIADIFPFIQKTCEFYSKENGGVHLVFIDNLTDLIESVNDEKLATNIIRELSILAKKYECGIIGVIHENEKMSSGGGLRGHIGSQAQRKSQTVLFVNKEKGENYHTIDFPILRSGHFPNKVKFVYEPNKGTMIYKGVISQDNIEIAKFTVDETYRDIVGIIKANFLNGVNFIQPYVEINPLYFTEALINYRLSIGKKTEFEYPDAVITKAINTYKLFSLDGGYHLIYDNSYDR